MSLLKPGAISVKSGSWTGGQFTGYLHKDVYQGYYIHVAQGKTRKEALKAMKMELLRLAADCDRMIKDESKG